MLKQTSLSNQSEGKHIHFTENTNPRCRYQPASALGPPPQALWVFLCPLPFLFQFPSFRHTMPYARLHRSWNSQGPNGALLKRLKSNLQQRYIIGLNGLLRLPSKAISRSLENSIRAQASSLRDGMITRQRDLHSIKDM